MGVKVWRGGLGTILDLSRFSIKLSGRMTFGP
jgi:hypothetical protein